MRSLLLIVASFTVTILCWGVYGPVLHWGQELMHVSSDESTEGVHLARLRPFVCVGLAYFLIGVVVPAALLRAWGEKGHWTLTGVIWSLAGGALGALGALGIILAFNFGGKPVYVMPLVFGGAPVVNSFLTIYWAKKMKEIGAIFSAGLIMVVLGAVTVLIFAPTAKSATLNFLSFDGLLQLLSIALVIACWGAYGPVLHTGQAKMDHSRLRPLLCVGLAYFAIAVIVPNLLLSVSSEPSTYMNFKGTTFSLTAGAAGAIGALGIIMAFNFGGKPIYVMPLVFGGAPVVNTIFSGIEKQAFSDPGPYFPLFLAGIILVIAGAALVLVFAPRGPAPAKPAPKQPEPQPSAAPDTAAAE